MKKNDMILIAVIVFAAAAIFGWNMFRGQSADAEVEVTVDGTLYGIYDLDKDQKLEINQTNTLTIENHKADMTDANCPDLLCVHQKAVSRNGESIICLPNKVVVTVISKKEAEYDAVTN
ncbi:MAG: NusG domain II-containing protein [Hespellia sp.]|nr:NusG domain II-containing protein [Hespellia sp.]